MSNDPEFAAFDEGRPDAFKGNTVCPIDTCDEQGSEVYIFNHFVKWHKVCDKRDQLLDFLGDEEYLEWSPNPVDDFPIHSIHLKPGIKSHPVFTIEMYESYFGSVENAKELTSYQARSHSGYDLDSTHCDTYLEQRWYLLKKQRATSRTHKLYGSDWGGVSWSIYTRDGLECRVCGQTSQTQTGLTGLDVHHITPASEFDDKSAMNDASNLITLCNSCHGRSEGKHQDCDPDEFVRRARDDLDVDLDDATSSIAQ